MNTARTTTANWALVLGAILTTAGVATLVFGDPTIGLIAVLVGAILGVVGMAGMAVSRPRSS
jgi:hypothetical protein